MKRKCVFSVVAVITLTVLSAVAFTSSLAGKSSDEISEQSQYRIVKILIFFFCMACIASTKTKEEKVIKDKTTRNLVAIAYTLAVTFAVGKWAIYAAHLERGYEAVGGEYCLMFMVGWMAWKAIDYLFDTLEDLEYERNCKKRRSGGTSWVRDNR